MLEFVLFELGLIELCLFFEQIGVDFGQSFLGCLLLAQLKLQVLHFPVDLLELSALLLENGDLLHVEVVFLSESVGPDLKRCVFVDLSLEHSVQSFHLVADEGRVVLELRDNAPQVICFSLEVVDLVLLGSALAQLLLQLFDPFLVLSEPALVFLVLGSLDFVPQLVEFLVEPYLVVDEILVLLLGASYVCFTPGELIAEHPHFLCLALEHVVESLYFLAQDDELALVLPDLLLPLLALHKLLLQLFDPHLAVDQLDGLRLYQFTQTDHFAAQLRVLSVAELYLRECLLVLVVEFVAAAGHALTLLFEFLLNDCGGTLRRSMNCLSLPFSVRSCSSPWIRAASYLICIS